jgi:cell division septation protein DedD
MQDMDLYTGKQNNYFVPQMETADPDYFNRVSEVKANDEVKSHKKATRLIAFVSAMCIVSFTAGLVTGIKFAGGADKPLVDPHTRQTVSSLSQRVTGAQPAEAAEVTDAAAQTSSKNYPRADYPWVIRIGNEYSREKAIELANVLSAKGHMMVLSKHEQNYRLYAGPFKTKESAELSLQKIKGYNDSRWQNNAVILKR